MSSLSPLLSGRRDESYRVALPDAFFGGAPLQERAAPETVAKMREPPVLPLRHATHSHS